MLLDSATSLHSFSLQFHYILLCPNTTWDTYIKLLHYEAVYGDAHL